MDAAAPQKYAMLGQSAVEGHHRRVHSLQCVEFPTPGRPCILGTQCQNRQSHQFSLGTVHQSRTASRRPLAMQGYLWSCTIEVTCRVHNRSAKKGIANPDDVTVRLMNC
ncbi:unnamed protein product [Ostreobium quekettii]|uniref:Uncharacterized protein n=1 Tax=Ostreobium quekettii TaxID=121088 RepID=A0A8S1J977_9CHLO|nr:unnamed protein product [Ostreobium quekettii]